MEAARVYIIAEAGVNHNGDEKKAFELVDIAASAGADAVKFQLFNPESLVTARATTAEYQARNLNDTHISQRQMLEKLTLPEGAFIRLAQHCQEKNIDFLCTPFDHESLHYLVTNTKMPYLKLPSGEITNGPFLLAAARTGLRIILSTGMSNIEEIATALCVLHFGYTHATGMPANLAEPTPPMLKYLREKVMLLHCVSQYPAPVRSINLRAMDTLERHFGLPVGLSDHSLGIAMPVVAVARGAVAIEKHFTYDTKANGPDHAASLSPQQLKEMVAAIRDVAPGLGNGEKICQPEETDTRTVARKSVVAATAIAKGEPFSEQNLTCKRPATGLSPNHLWELLGKSARNDYAAEGLITKDELES